jgi:hypothetical protein
MCIVHRTLCITHRASYPGIILESIVHRHYMPTRAAPASQHSETPAGRTAAAIAAGLFQLVADLIIGVSGSSETALFPNSSA